MHRNFYGNLTAIYRNFTAIFAGLGDRNPPPLPHPFGAGNNITARSLGAWGGFVFMCIQVDFHF